MCGIAAEIATGRPVPGRVAAMLEPIRHRGDGENFGRVATVAGAVFGCNRLAIVDRDAAVQPMSDGSLSVAFNGEIYNHAELRATLTAHGHRFRTESDTEVLLHGYRQWRGDLPRHLDGIFAFVVYDADTGAYLCARDRLGVKPLYRARENGALLLASEIKSFGPLGLVPETFPPGHAADRNREWSYDSRPTEPWQHDEETAAAELVRLLDEAVYKRTRTDLPIGVIYSGGVDSAAVLGLALRHHPDVTAISVGLPGAVDLPVAVRSCAELGVRHVVRDLDIDDLIRRLPAIVRQTETFELVDIMDACVMAPAFETARELGIKVVLVGDGSDEQFAGYELFRDHPEPVELSRYRVRNLHRTDLHRVDRASMLHSVEARVPFLDPAVVDLAWRLPMDYKRRDGIEKWILRKAISGVIPDHLAWRPKVRMPEGTGLLFQLIEYARDQRVDLDEELVERLHIDSHEMAYCLRSYVDSGYPVPRARYRRSGWDYAPNGYFQFDDAPLSGALEGSPAR
jgi:asparagine synthase (glutamine-hydrolysing)